MLHAVMILNDGVSTELKLSVVVMLLIHV